MHAAELGGHADHIDGLVFASHALTFSNSANWVRSFFSSGLRFLGTVIRIFAMRSPRPPPKLAQTLSRQPESLSALSPCWDLHRDLGPKGRHLDFAAERGRRVTHRNLDLQVLPVGRELGVIDPFHDHIEVTGPPIGPGRTLARNPQLLTILDSGGDLDFDLLGSRYRRDSFPGPLGVHRLIGQGALRSGIDLFERDLDDLLDVPALRDFQVLDVQPETAALPCSSAAEDLYEDRLEAAHPRTAASARKVEPGSAVRSRPRLLHLVPVRAELVVHLPLLGIAEHVVSLADLLELASADLSFGLTSG